MAYRMNDVIVVLPGIMGSTLADKDGTLVWAPSAGAVMSAITTFGRHIQALTLPPGIGDQHPGDGVTPVALMPDLHLLPGIWSANIGYEALLNWLRRKFDLVESLPGGDSPAANLLPIPYDWRLSNRYNARRLKSLVEPALERWRARGGECAEARLIFICHSMGGLVARQYLELEGGAEYTRKLITLGTPYRGALNALDQLINGVRKGIGPLQLDLTHFARSLPSTYQLLPEYACIESPTGLLKTTQTTLPVLDTYRVADAMRFHDDLDAAHAAHGPGGPGYDLHPIVGMLQPTLTTAQAGGNHINPLPTIKGQEEAGDGTVPRFAAIPKAIAPTSPVIHFVPDQHGSLQSNRAVLDQLEGILSSQPVIHYATPTAQLGLEADALLLAGEPLAVMARLEGERMALLASLYDEAGRRIAQQPLQPARDAFQASFAPQAPGAYRITVEGIGTARARVEPVSVTTLVWDGGAN